MMVKARKGQSWPLTLREDASFDVVGFGFNTLDHACVVSPLLGFDTKQRLTAYTQQPGGQVPTALVACQRWGLRTAYVGPFGSDDGGRLQRASLEREGIDLTGSRTRSDVGSQVSVILIDQVSGERTVLWQRPDGLALRAGELDRGVLTGGRVLLMDAGDTETAIIVAEWARSAGVRVVLDVDEPTPRTSDLLSLADVVVVPDQFPQRLTGTRELRTALRRMSKGGPILVAITLGTGGVLACTGGRYHHVPAHPVLPVDTTGAGDVFHAGCLYGMLQGWPLSQMLEFAAAAAALSCEQLGGRAGIPPLSRALSLARSH